MTTKQLHALNTFKPYAVFYRTGGQIEKFYFQVSFFLLAKEQEPFYFHPKFFVKKEYQQKVFV